MRGNVDFSELIHGLPEQPGVYQFFDKNGTIIYIGKAKNLKKRVSSYFFRNKLDSFKIKVLVDRIADMKYIVVNSESDALLLENNLIKKHQPRYNVMLKDDKTFPWICVKNEPFPRVFSTRNRISDGSVYYGPYTSVIMVKTILELVRQLFPLRTCRLNLAADQITKGKYKVCLEYHLGNCKGPCVGLQQEREYRLYIDQVHQILKGNIKQVIARMRKLMKQYAESQKFEDAQLLKDKILILEKYRSKSTIVSTGINNVDVFTIVEEDNLAFVNYLKVINGADLKQILNQLRYFDPTLFPYEIVTEGMTSQFIHDLASFPNFRRILICSPWVHLKRKVLHKFIYSIFKAQEKAPGNKVDVILIARPLNLDIQNMKSFWAYSNP